MTDLMDLSAVELLVHYRRKTLSPSDVFAALEARVAACEPTIRALYAHDPEGARHEAAASTARWALGAPVGPLDGLPVTLKELIATRGVPVPKGTAATDPVPAAEDAPPAARLREDGAIVFAKTACPDLGMLSSGVSSFHATTRNPWDPTKNPGGSSSGAAAAGAAGYGPLHIGTDIGGSVRLPAGWTGLFGFKPSQGRIPIDPFYVGRCAGPMTRTVADTALVMPTLARPDWRDATSLPPADLPWHDLRLDCAGMRLGLLLDAGCGLTVEDEIAAAVLSAAKAFEARGAVLVPVRPVMTRAMLDGLDRFWRARSWSDLADFDEARRAKVLPYILRWAERGAEISGVEAVRGFNQTFAMRQACAALFRSVDAVLSPTNPIVSFPAEWAGPTNDPDRPLEHIAFTVPWNMADHPAASIHCGLSRSGMPMGLQVVGPRFDDMRVLRLCQAFETWRGPIPAWPKVGR